MTRAVLGPLFGWESADHDAAWQRAEALLRDSLTPDQYASYERRGYVEVPSGLHPGRTYRVDGWRPVAMFEEGEFVGAICIRPPEALPGPDVILARKLLIEGAEQEFLEQGNWLSPALSPMGTIPTVLMIAVVLSPWLLHLSRFGPAGIAAAVALIVVPLWFLWRSRPRGPTSISEPDGVRGA